MLDMKGAAAAAAVVVVVVVVLDILVMFHANNFYCLTVVECSHLYGGHIHDKCYANA